MNFDLDEDQRTIKRTAREFLAARYGADEVRRLALEDERGFTEAQWEEIVGLGWPGLAVPEERGGMGLGAVELAVVAEELGFALAPTPLQSSWMAALLVLHGDGADHVLAALASGERRGAVAVASAEDGGWLVPDAGAADTLVLGDRVVDADAVELSPVEGLDPSRRLFRVRDEVDGERLSGDVEGGRRWIQVILAAESTGIAQRCMEMSVAYAKERKQFGRPIGTYQAVSHRCAQMLLEIEGARALVYNAAWALDHAPDEAPLAVAMAKSYAGDTGARVAASAIQVHGGIGFTWEADLHLFLKRAKANALAFDGGRELRGRVAELLAL